MNPHPLAHEFQPIPEGDGSGGAECGAVGDADPLAGFVASLTTEQRAKLAELLTAPPVPR